MICKLMHFCHIFGTILIAFKVTRQAHSQAKSPEGAKPFAMKSRRQGNTDGDILYLNVYRVQSEAPEDATGPTGCNYTQCTRLATGLSCCL